MNVITEIRRAELDSIEAKYGPTYAAFIASASGTLATLDEMSCSKHTYDAWMKAIERHRVELGRLLNEAAKVIEGDVQAPRMQAEQDANRVVEAMRL